MYSLSPVMNGISYSSQPLTFFERIYEIAVEIVGIAVITVVIVNYYEPANLVVFVVFAAVEPER